MIEVVHHLDIRASVQRVFDFLADPRNDPKWNGEILETVVGDDVIGVDSRFVTRARFLGMKFDTELEVTEFDRPSVYANRARSGPVPFEVRWVFTERAGGTHVERLSRADVGYFRFAESIVARMADRGVAANFRRIRQILETDNVTS